MRRRGRPNDEEAVVAISVDRHERLARALGLISLYGTQRKIAAGLRLGLEPLRRHWQGLAAAERAELDGQIAELVEHDVDVVLKLDDEYPDQLRQIPGSPPMLFWRGDRKLLYHPGVGMCGSRQVSEAGLTAARVAGRRVAHEQLTIISGYAKGVDTETHIAAIESGGRTVIVLAEGILHFRTKRVFTNAGLDLEQRALVLSQFPPRQPWNVGAAMARNAIIAGLGHALIVIEAGATGGTLDAGKKALAMGRPVIALEFSDGTPEGNQILFELGAHRAPSTGTLAEVLGDIARTPQSTGTAGAQLTLDARYEFDEGSRSNTVR